jgi:CBS domain-containing protein
MRRASPRPISTPLKQLDAESSALRGADGMTAEQLMEPGPSTIRADEMIEGLRERMEEGDLKASLVTTPDGTLLGIVRRSDLSVD